MELCKGITKTGKKCNKKALPSGYCNLHDPTLLKEKNDLNNLIKEKRKKIDELLAVITNCCERLGWHCSIKDLDEQDFKFSTISVSKNVPKGNDYERITALIMVHIQNDNSISYSIEKTSFYDYGTSSLFKFISEQLKENGYSSKKEKSKQDNPDNSLEILTTIFKKFHVFSQQLQKRFDNRTSIIINDEYDVQDLIHSILKLFFNDIRKEEYSPSKSGANSRIDFLIKEEKILIETKMASSNLNDKKIAEQLIIDKDRYKSHPDCKKIFCFIYDLNFNIKNPYGLESDLSEIDKNFEFRVMIYPK